MALNLYRKINATIAKNCKRFLQNNAQKLTQVSNILEENQVQKEVDKNKFNKFSISSHERTTPSENPRLWANAFEPERDMIQRGLQNRYLQPATMPTYRDEPIFDTNFMASLQEEPIKKAKNIVLNNSASQQILESFKKKQAQNLPTRKPRLTSNPFPEPLKAIFSPYTISDQEKADQMLLDQKSLQMNLINGTGNSQLTSNNDAIKSSKKFYCTMTPREKSQDILDRVMGISSLHSKEFFSLSSDQVRCFSSKSGGNEVCKDSTKPKMKSCLPRKCNKITIKGCPPVRRNTICKQKNKEVHCKKIDAPYPSYSESCYMEPRARKTECDLCPWTEKNNPNFKGKLKIPPKFYHTDCMSSSAATTNGGFSVKNFPDQDALKNFSQRWMHKANLSQVYIKGKKMPTMDCFEPVKKPIVRRWLFNVTKDSNIVEQNSKNEVPMPIENFKFGYCDRHHTVLTEFFMKNDDLLRNFKNGDDLSDFGIKKTKLSKILSCRELFDVVCKKGERIIPDYPKDCERPYQDTTKTCPSGLTRRKTKKDRLKRKIPKDQSCK